MSIVPWISMPTQPRATIRAVIDVQPRYGIFYLSWIYGLQACFYCANYWSLGLSFSLKFLILLSLAVSPFFGMASLFFVGSMLQITGRWLGGKASSMHLRSAVAWAKIPLILFIPIWAFFIWLDSERVFILGASHPSPILIHAVSFVLGGWSQILRVQSVREVQGFSFARSLASVGLAWFLSAFLYFSLFCLVRFICILFIN